MRKERKSELSLSLFPFLGVFVCVIGLFAFLDICLFLVSRPITVRSGTSDEQGKRRRPYVVWCDGESLRLRPPAIDPAALRADIDPDATDALARIASIGSDGEIDETVLETVLSDIAILNRHAATHRLPHEGYLTVAVTSSGTQCYWKIAERLRSHQSIGMSALAVLPGWELREESR